jgi:hypothetical protein
MGIDIRAGALAELLTWDLESAAAVRERIARMNEALRDAGLPEHVEPETLPRLERRACVGTDPRWVLCLKRALACVAEEVPLRAGPYTDEDGDFVGDANSVWPESHLLSHSPRKGYFVPIHSPKLPLLDHRVPGDFLCSSQGLLKELKQVAAPLGLELVEGELSPASLALLTDIDGLEAHPHRSELLAWHQLWEEAQISIAHRTMIILSS